MGGRGASSGIIRSSAEYKDAYNIEMENAKNFEAAFAVEADATKDAIGYQMYVHQDVTGRSLIADTRKEIEFQKRELRQANQVGRSYGMTQNAIEGMKAGIREKIGVMEKAVSNMEAARAEYQKFKVQASVGNAKAKRLNGKWM